jgi:NAD(P) transhydrogenase
MLPTDKIEQIKVDLVVIGSGPSGQKAAIQGSKLGKSVLVIDRLPDAGGNCLYSGTIPSKSFREAIIDLTRFNERAFRGQRYDIETVTMKELMNRLQQVINEERSVIHRQLRRNGVRVIMGNASFEDPHKLVILDKENRLLCEVTADYFVIASGSKPRNPIDVPFDQSVILDSTSLLQIERVPKSMIVLGGGIIGSEYASFFAALGTEVTVIDKREHMLPMLDSEIGVHLQTALTEIGLHFVGQKQPEVIRRIGDHAQVICTDGYKIEAEILLYALGRVANVDGLQLINTGIQIDSRGYIEVNELFQTCVPHIYAVGDVIGGPCLASTSMEQGRLAVRHAFGYQIHHFPTVYPIGIYTIPEISSCGLNEDELKERGFHYEVGRAYYYEIARSHITGSHIGMFKILFHAETLEILGVHIIGRGASEVIHIGQLAMSFNAKIDYFIDQIFNYPTYAEGYRIAALNGYNKVSPKFLS